VCNDACIAFAARVLTADVVRDADVLEVGSYDTTGTVRPLVERLRPRRYIGVDIVPGPRVDIICDVHELVGRFGAASFDVVIATELLEHIREWRHAIEQMLSVLRPGGLLLVTTRSPGFPFHYGPFDWWRFEVADMETMFGGAELIALEHDPIAPGVFVLVRTRDQTPEVPRLALYSVITGRRTSTVSDLEVLRWRLGSPKRMAHLLPAGLQGWLRRAVRS
jgi:SAM-dependent methyltransferase